MNTHLVSMNINVVLSNINLGLLNTNLLIEYMLDLLNIKTALFRTATFQQPYETACISAIADEQMETRLE